MPVDSMPGFPGGSVVKNLPVSAGEVVSIPGLGRSPREENGNPLQYSCLENPMDRGACWATVHGVTNSWTQLINSTTTITTYVPITVQKLFNNSVGTNYPP